MTAKKSKKQLEASGSTRAKDRIDLERPQSGKGIKKPPEYLNEDECKIWDRLLPKAIEMKTYQKADHDSFAQFCRALNTLLVVQDKLLKSGFIIDVTYEVGQGQERRTVHGQKESPLFLTEKRCLYNYNLFAAQFGFNPLSRTRLQITPYQAGSGAPTAPTPLEPDDDDDGSGPKSKILEMMNLKPTG